MRPRSLGPRTKGGEKEGEITKHGCAHHHLPVTRAQKGTLLTEGDFPQHSELWVLRLCLRIVLENELCHQNWS